MPLIYPLSFFGGNVTEATYTVGGFDFSGIFEDKKPGQFTVDSNNGLHKQFESDANHTHSEFAFNGAATYRIEVTSVPTISVGGANASVADFTLTAGILIYDDGTFAQDLQTPDFDVCDFVNGSQTSIASVGDTQTVSVPSADDALSTVPVVRKSSGFAVYATGSTNQITISGNFGFKVTKLV